MKTLKAKFRNRIRRLKERQQWLAMEAERNRARNHQSKKPQLDPIRETLAQGAYLQVAKPIPKPVAPAREIKIGFAPVKRKKR